MLAITVFWIVAFSVMIYFMIKEWNSLSRATRAKVRTRTAVQLDPDARSPRSRSMSTKPTPHVPYFSFPRQNLKLRTVIIPGRGAVQIVAKPAPPGDPEYVHPAVSSQGPKGGRKRMVEGELPM